MAAFTEPTCGLLPRTRLELFEYEYNMLRHVYKLVNQIRMTIDDRHDQYERPSSPIGPFNIFLLTILMIQIIFFCFPQANQFVCYLFRTLFPPLKNNSNVKQDVVKPGELFSCPICYEDIATGSTYSQLQCCSTTESKKNFHTNCLSKCAQISSKCPFCNRQVF